MCKWFSRKEKEKRVGHLSSRSLIGRHNYSNVYQMAAVYTEYSGFFLLTQNILIGLPLKIRFSASTEKINTFSNECENSLLVWNLAHTSFYTVCTNYKKTAGTWRKSHFWPQGNFLSPPHWGETCNSSMSIRQKMPIGYVRHFTGQYAGGLSQSAAQIWSVKLWGGARCLKLQLWRQLESRRLDHVYFMSVVIGRPPPPTCQHGGVGHLPAELLVKEKETS